jgi:hypothetical protein
VVVVVVVVAALAAPLELPSAWLDPRPMVPLPDGPISPTVIKSMTATPHIATAMMELRRNMVEPFDPVALRRILEGPVALALR